MNLTINELERRLYISNRQSARAMLLMWVEAWDVADERRIDLAEFDTEPEELTPELVEDAALKSRFTRLP
jgi:hypothetical protein